MTEERRQPAYGELAPEGWEWKPAAAEETPRGGSPVPGVPHNLGTQGGEAPAPAAPQRQDGDPEPYRATQPPQLPPAPSPAQGFPGGPRRRNPADLAITIVLLVVGAFGALVLAQSMMGLAPSLALVADALELSDFAVPSWVPTAGLVTGLGMFALYAVALIWSIQRMRAKKIAFWVPLAAGVLAVIALFVVTTAVTMSMPELLERMSDPDATQRLLDSLTQMEP